MSDSTKKSVVYVIIVAVVGFTTNRIFKKIQRFVLENFTEVMRIKTRQ